MARQRFKTKILKTITMWKINDIPAPPIFTFDVLKKSFSCETTSRIISNAKPFVYRTSNHRLATKTDQWPIIPIPRDRKIMPLLLLVCVGVSPLHCHSRCQVSFSIPECSFLEFQLSSDWFTSLLAATCR
jgi:hypothetical protein